MSILLNAQNTAGVLANVFTTQKNGSKPFGVAFVHLKRSQIAKYEPLNVFGAAWGPVQTCTPYLICMHNEYTPTSSAASTFKMNSNSISDHFFVEKHVYFT
jgi:hypothetical protein